jgi:hypothetical protein
VASALSSRPAKLLSGFCGSRLAVLAASYAIMRRIGT